MANHATIGIQFLRAGEIREYALAFSAIDTVYSNLYALDLIVGETKKRGGSKVLWARERNVRMVIGIRNAFDVVLPEDRLRLKSIDVGSPGWLEVIGTLNPLETLRKYLQDRHERQKDRGRKPAALERLALENDKLKLEVMKERMDLLRELGVPEEKIRQIVARHFFEPIETIDALQDTMLIGAATHEKGKSNK